MIMPRLPSVTQLISDTGVDLGPTSRKSPPLYLNTHSSSATPSSLPASYIALPRIQLLAPSPSSRDASSFADTSLASSSSSTVSTSPLLALDPKSMQRSYANGYVYSTPGSLANAAMIQSASFSRNSRSTAGTPDQSAVHRLDPRPLSIAILPGGPLDTQLSAGGPSSGDDHPLPASKAIPSTYVKENYRIHPSKHTPSPSLPNQYSHYHQQPLHSPMRPQHQQHQHQHQHQHQQQQTICPPISIHTQQLQHHMQQQRMQQQQMHHQLHQHQLQQQQMNEYQRQQQQVQQHMYHQRSHQYQQGAFMHSPNQSRVPYSVPMPLSMLSSRPTTGVGSSDNERRHVANQEQVAYQTGQPQYAMLPQNSRHSYPAPTYAPHFTIYRPSFENDMNSPSRMPMYASPTPQQRLVTNNSLSMAPGGATPNNRRVVKRRTRTGCFTCRQRRIKCDERKPFCMNCERSKKCCLGYDESNGETAGGQTKRKFTSKNEEDSTGRQGASIAGSLLDNQSDQSSNHPSPSESRKVKLESDQGSKSRSSGKDFETTNAKRARSDSTETSRPQESPGSSYHLESTCKRNAINDLLNDEENRTKSTMCVSPATRQSSPDNSTRVSSVHKLIEQSGCMTRA